MVVVDSAEEFVVSVAGVRTIDDCCCHCRGLLQMHWWMFYYPW